MKSRKSIWSALLLPLLLVPRPLPPRDRAAKAISAERIKFHLRFLSALEFEGRNTPSTGLNIASRYLAMLAEQCGLSPLMPDGSYFQQVPLEVVAVSPFHTYLRCRSRQSDVTFHFPASFTLSARSAQTGAAAGPVVFLGLGASAPELQWDDWANEDLKGKIVVVLDGTLPDGHPLRSAASRAPLFRRSRTAWERGAIALLTVISPERERNLAKNGQPLGHSPWPRLRDPTLEEKAVYLPGTPTSMPQLEIRHQAAAQLLGLSLADIAKMFEEIAAGRRVLPREIGGQTVEIGISLEKRTEESPNVVAYLPGSDRSLRHEYVVVGAHHDHNGTSEGRVFPGSDDNVSGSVAMLEIARAMRMERPRRSVIFVWHTAEEKGLKGAYYFVMRCPVPVEKISAMLNLDMLTRNDPNGVYLICADKISRELDLSIRKMNDRAVRLRLDYRYNDASHPERFFFRSDHLPYMRYGIPGVWFFCGTTADYHRETDTVDKTDWSKMEKITRLAYLTAMDIADRDRLLPLNANPEISSRGEHNLRVDWWRPLREKEK